MRIFQLSDIHIGKPGELPNDIDVRSNFKRIVDNIESYKPDIIVISGDLAYRHGDKKISRDTCLPLRTLPVRCR